MIKENVLATLTLTLSRQGDKCWMESIQGNFYPSQIKGQLQVDKWL